MEALKTSEQSTESVPETDVESLLAEAGEAGPTTADAPVSTKDNQSDTEPDTRHGFPQFSSLSGGEMRKMKMRHDEFVRSLETRLSAHLRLECGLQLSKFETVRFQRFMDGLAAPTHLTLFEIEPLEGLCFLNIPSRLGLSIVDRELGGPAHKQEEARDLSAIESTLLARVVEIITGEWCAAWSDILNLRAKLLRHESDGRFLKVHEPDALMLVLGVEVHVGETVEVMQLALLFSALEPLLKKLNSNPVPTKPSAASQTARPLKWNLALGDVELQVTAELPDLAISARQLGQLKPGDVIPMPADIVNRVQVSLASTPKFTGSLGTCDQRWAVQISQVLKS